VHGDRREAHKCAKACTLSVVIQALEFKPVGPQNQWVDAMFLTSDILYRSKIVRHEFVEFLWCILLQILEKLHMEDIDFLSKLLCLYRNVQSCTI
jgi:hypothetical protein